MQFANSDIEDLQIVEGEQKQETAKQQPVHSMPAKSSAAAPAQPSIHDDPAIVSAVVSSSDKDHRASGSTSNRLMHAFQQMNVSDDPSKAMPQQQQGSYPY